MGFQSVFLSGQGHNVIGVVVEGGVIGSVSGHFLVDFIIRGRGGGLRVVGEAVGAGEVGQIPLREAQTGNRRHKVAVVEIAVSVRDVAVHVEGKGIQRGMGVCAQTDFIGSRFQQIAACAVSVKRGDVLLVKGKRQRFGSAGSQRTGFVKRRQIDRRFFNAAVCVGRRDVQFHNILAGFGTGICYRYFHRYGSVRNNRLS